MGWQGESHGGMTSTPRGEGGGVSGDRWERRGRGRGRGEGEEEEGLERGRGLRERERRVCRGPPGVVLAPRTSRLKIGCGAVAVFPERVRSVAAAAEESVLVRD